MQTINELIPLIQQKDERPTVGRSMLVSAFPGTGKSHYVNNLDYMPQGFATDSDSSKFDKSKFPENYIEHIKEKVSEEFVRIFISSHKDVREALVAHNLPFVLVYPSLDLKYEYMERYKQRGSGDQFIQLISNNWDNWINDCKSQTGCFRIELKSGQYLSNVL